MLRVVLSLTPRHFAESWDSGNGSSLGTIMYYRRLIVLVTTVAVLTVEDDADTDFVEGLKFVGLTPPHARALLQRWQGRGEGNPDCFRKYLRYYLVDQRVWAARRAVSVNDDQYLAELGISEPIRQAILDPEFKQIRGTRNLFQFASDTLLHNLDVIFPLQHNLQLTSSDPTTRALATTSRDARREPPLDTKLNLTSSPPPNPRDHTFLYLGLSAHPNGRSLIDSHNDLNLGRHSTFHGSDFHANPAFYLFPDREVADRHRAYAARRCPAAESWLVRFAVPDTFLASLVTERLHFSSEWKRYVWKCRSGRSYPRRHGNCERYGRAELVVGPVFTMPEGDVREVEEGVVQTRITEGNVLRVGHGVRRGEEARQYAFLGPGVWGRLEGVVRGGVHVENTPALFETVCA
ncbi:DNA repair protein RAD5 [Elsinoe australis]|uniref:DNA repair protein RAD5 n=1 Tax=Elsinoe australis TaxID=40998 RepID=A0A2P8ABF9_9PEZI|nr:DNA repair protein RAD5 [Elsinoe australis]